MGKVADQGEIKEESLIFRASIMGCHDIVLLKALLLFFHLKLSGSISQAKSSGSRYVGSPNRLKQETEVKRSTQHVLILELLTPILPSTPSPMHVPQCGAF